MNFPDEKKLKFNNNKTVLQEILETQEKEKYINKKIITM